MLRKNLLFILLLLLATPNLQSQNLRFGLLAGANATKMITGMGDRFVGDGTYNPYAYDPMLSFNVNGIAELRFLKWFGLSAEPGFITKGGNTFTLEGEDASYKINYLQLPVLGEFFLANRFSISFGPEFAYALSAKFKTNGLSDDIKGKPENKNEISGIVGIHFMLSKKLGVGLKYSYGLTKVNTIIMTGLDGAVMGTYDENNQYLQLNLRWYFGGSDRWSVSGKR